MFDFYYSFFSVHLTRDLRFAMVDNHLFMSCDLCVGLGICATTSKNLGIKGVNYAAALFFLLFSVHVTRDLRGIAPKPSIHV